MGQRIETVIGQHCGVRTLEELRFVQSIHIVTDFGYAGYAKLAVRCGFVPLSMDSHHNHIVWSHKFSTVTFHQLQRLGRGQNLLSSPTRFIPRGRNATMRGTRCIDVARYRAVFKALS